VTFADWSIRYKLLSLLLLWAVYNAGGYGNDCIHKKLTALRESVFDQLTGVTRSKRSQIESYYRTIHSDVETLMRGFCYRAALPAPSGDPRSLQYDSMN
jgi:hypothetical protein